MMKILGITSIRSDYDLMSNVFAKLNSDNQIDFRLLVSGAHLSKSYGYTISNIKKDNFKILIEIESLINSDSFSSRLKTASCLLSGSIDVVRQFAPNLILYAGDREDVLIGSMLGCFLRIPTIHFFSGDHASDGHIDNLIRHATSKLSSIHFVSTMQHKERLVKLGEAKNRIFVIGNPGLDKFVEESFLERKELLDKISKKEIEEKSKIAIFIFHPIEKEKNVADRYVRNALNGLLDHGYHIFLGSSNTDPGNFKINETMESFSKNPKVTYYHNLNRNYFVNLLRHSDLIIGNSSAGLLEAGSIPIPAINIGLRQKGRMCGENVVFCEGSYQKICDAIKKVESFEFKEKIQTIENPYGKGQSSKNAYKIIKNLKIEKFIDKPEDPLFVNTFDNPG